MTILTLVDVHLTGPLHPDGRVRQAARPGHMAPRQCSFTFQIPPPEAPAAIARAMTKGPHHA